MDDPVRVWNRERTLEITIRLREDKLRMCRELTGLGKDAALAIKMGMSPATVSRVLNDEQAPSAQFIARLLAAFKHAVPFEDLFEVVKTELQQTA